MSEQAILAQLIKLLDRGAFIESDTTSIDDMFKRYANPPFTMAHRAAIRLTVSDAQAIASLIAEYHKTHFFTQYIDNRPNDTSDT